MNERPLDMIDAELADLQEQNAALRKLNTELINTLIDLAHDYHKAACGELYCTEGHCEKASI